jgi:hypothetical protein|tara:strand:+ start:276 stop:626 length:351 start_codon:yes stop_codon:yes gene_type:complete
VSQIRYETEADMASYLDPNYGHGQTAVYGRGGVNTSINLILNEEFVELDEGIGVEAAQPIAYCRSIDIPSVSHGDTLAVSAYKDVDGNILKAAGNYKIVNVQKDNKGFTALVLEEQ